MPGKEKVDFKTYRQVLEVFQAGELNKQTSVADKYKNAEAMMKVAGEYLTDRGVDITKPFETEEILKGWENRGPGRDHLEEVANAFKLSKQRVEEIRQKVGETRKENAAKKTAEWYNDVVKDGFLRPSGESDFVESNALDWKRLRILKDGKLEPFMGEIHMGALPEAEMERLKKEAEKGNVFYYRLGEAYPHRLVGDSWQSINPATKEEKRPELKLPEEPKAPEPLKATLDEELRAKGFSTKTKREKLPQDQRLIYDQTMFDRSMREIKYRKAKEQYQKDLQQYEAEREKLTQEHNAEVQAWEERVGFYDKLDDSIRQAVEGEASQRTEEITRNQETQRATEIDNRPLVDWYRNEFRKSMVRNSGAVDLVESDGMDWSRVRIWDGEKFARAMPEGHKGAPDAEAIRNLRSAAENGNLFMYQRGDKYPSKWNGYDWVSMDKGWIERSKPKEVEPLPGKPEKPRQIEPMLHQYTRSLSDRKLAVNRFFSTFRINVYKSEREEYDKAVADYEKDRDTYERNMSEYEQQLAAYNKRMEPFVEAYDRGMVIYEHMLKSYETLTEQQRTAMELDVGQREAEIKANKELEQKKAEDQLVNEQKSKDVIEAVDDRIDANGNRPQEEDLAPLGKNAYELIAPHGYDLPANSRLSAQEAATIHIALAGSAQAALNGGLSPLSAEQYGQMLDGVLYGQPSETDMKYIAASFDAAKGYIAKFESNDPKELADALSTGLRNLITVGKDRMEMTPEMAGLAKLTGRILDVMDTYPALMDNSDLSKEEMNLARGMVNLGQMYNNYIEARMELTNLAAGVKPLSQELVQENTVNLFIGQAVENALKRDEVDAEKLVTNLGTGNTLETVQETYKNDPNVKQFAIDPQTLKETDLNKRMQDMGAVVAKSTLAKPKESTQLREQVLNQVRTQREMNSEQTLEAARRAQELETLERQQVRYMLAQEDGKYQSVSLRDPVITEKLNELRQAREALEAQTDMQHEKLTFRKKDMETNEYLKQYAEREEYQNLKPDDLIVVEGETANQRFELTDERVLQEAMERASVRELMAKENTGRENEGSSPEMKEFALRRRMQELRQAKAQLEAEDNQMHDLTSDEVVAKAAAIRTERAEQFKKRAQEIRDPFEELIRTEKVYLQEYGKKPDGWVEEIPFYRSKTVIDRFRELKTAREKLGEEGRNLAIDDPKVIQKDYKLRKIDPIRDGGIVDLNSMTEAQRKDYMDRMEAVDYLRDVRGKTNLVRNNHADRHHGSVETAVRNLNAARRDYEALGEDAEKNLKLNDPKIVAMHMFNSIQSGTRNKTKVTLEDVRKLAQDIQGKTYWDAEAVGKQQLQEIQARQAQAQQQQAQQQIQPQPH